jgi:hypothetical protein
LELKPTPNEANSTGLHGLDQEVMHGFSTLDSNKPGDPTLLVETTVKMSSFLQQLNQNVEVFLSATWSRADLVCKVNRHWSCTSIKKMALAVRTGYNKAAAVPIVKSINGVVKRRLEQW